MARLNVNLFAAKCERIDNIMLLSPKHWWGELFTIASKVPRFPGIFANRGLIQLC